MRDLTRGGLASALVEIAETAQLQIALVESAIPVCDDVRGACEILGLDPMYVANEGRFVCFVPQGDVERVCAILHGHRLGAGACVIGQVTDTAPGIVTMTSAIGSERIVDRLSGEQLPRIC
jgi:hydrogenase expression/formation protein HypE